MSRPYDCQVSVLDPTGSRANFWQASSVVTVTFMRRRTLATFVFWISLAAGVAPAAAQQAAPRSGFRASRATGPIAVDGRLIEEAWSRADVADHFTQRDPAEGQPATERTEIRVLYDDEAIYIAARLFDGHPERIVRRLSNRDDPADADAVSIYLDPRHDRLTGAMFRVSAAGVQADNVISNDTNEDGSWDAVWTSAVTVDAQGWCAELRIPFSQLRFNAAPQQTWGINVERYIHRKNEWVWLELVLKNENGLASRMVPLTGLDGIRPARRIELAPYAAIRQEFVQPSRAGDPFNDGARTFGAVGLDLKAGITGGLTLDATINPDFGQAEVDPAVVNLSAFETFFDEKRRFFIEGSEIFGNFGTGGSNNFFGFNTSDPNLFYSRRIGRAPQAPAGGDFSDVPRATTILGAAKLTGKTANGWSIGLLDAVTSRERATILDGSARSRTQVEPLTNYLVARLKHDFSRGGAGLIATSVVRRLNTQLFKDLLTRRATVFGGDAFYFFDQKHEWVVTGKMSGSHISGSEAALTGIQLEPQRYFQRPDAPQVSFDPHRTSLSGYAGRVNLNRNAGVWKVNAALWGVSPGFESNDLGFHSNGDRAGGHAVLIWSHTKTTRVTRDMGVWVARAFGRNFNGDTLNNQWYGCANATFLNYWSSNLCGDYTYQSLDDRLTRGGPIAVNPAARGLSGRISTDSRKWVSLDLNGNHYTDRGGGRSMNANASVNLKPSSALTISTGPEFSRSHGTAQYVRTHADPAATATFGQRYVFAAIDQRQLVLPTRVNYILSPRASLRLFMQPLLATGTYDHYKQLAAPRTYEFTALGLTDFEDLNFNFKSLRANAVFRWEFRPGSTFYAVWTQERQDFSHPGDFSVRRDTSALLSAPANDVFLMKLTYWLGR